MDKHLYALCVALYAILKTSKNENDRYSADKVYPLYVHGCLVDGIMPATMESFHLLFTGSEVITNDILDSVFGVRVKESNT